VHPQGVSSEDVHRSIREEATVFEVKGLVAHEETSRECDA
jgi:hypothetical protein